MSRACDLTGMCVRAGNNVSHSHRKTKRCFRPNLQNVKYDSALLGRTVHLKVAARVIRTIDYKGGFDQFLMKTPARKLTTLGAKMRRKAVKKTLESNASGDVPAESSKVSAESSDASAKPSKAPPAEPSNVSAELDASAGPKAAPPAAESSDASAEPSKAPPAEPSDASAEPSKAPPAEPGDASSADAES